MNIPQVFVELLEQEFLTAFAGLEPPYAILAKEPLDSELGEGLSGPDERQIYIVDADDSFPEGIADEGAGTVVETPFIVSGVWKWPQSREATAAIRKRRRHITQVIQRAIRKFNDLDLPHVETVEFSPNEASELIDGFYVSKKSVLVRWYLPSEEAL